MVVANPTPQKRRGAYFTPRRMADFLVRWAIRNPSDHVLEPSCGDAIFLRSAVEHLRSFGGPLEPQQVIGFELEPGTAAAARSLEPSAEIIDGDFFAVSPGLDRYDAVVGNPPWVRYHHFNGEMRELALARARDEGVTLTKLTSSWAPFLVHASTFLAPAGRLAFVLPAELLGTDYAMPIRQFLQRRFARVDVLTFEERVFPGALVDAVVVLAEGDGPGEVAIHRLQDVSALDAWSADAAPLPVTERKWSQALVGSSALDALERAERHFVPLGDVASVDIGIVTGANDFFLLTDQEAGLAGLEAADLHRAIARASQLPGTSLTLGEWERQGHHGLPIWLFSPDSDDGAAGSYILAGEAAGVSDAYKCRVRKPWWRLRLPTPPDLFLSYMTNHAPRLVANEARVFSTNLVHNVRLRDSTSDARLLATAWLNSATMLSAELSGRAYGGGVLKLETKEAERIIVPTTSADMTAALRAVADEIDALLRDGQLLEAADMVDEIVLAGLSDERRSALRDGWRDLQNRRKRRSVKPVASR